MGTGADAPVPEEERESGSERNPVHLVRLRRGAGVRHGRTVRGRLGFRRGRAVGGPGAVQDPGTRRSRTRGPAGSRSRSGRCPRRPCASAGSASCPRRRPAGPCRRSWPGGGRTAGGWLRSSCLYRAARRRRRGGPRGKARRPYCRWRPAAARTGCRVPPRSGRDGACGSAPGCCGVWVPGSCRRRSAPRLRLRPVGVDGYDVAVRERAELHDIAVVFEAVSDEMGEECARGAIAACIVPCGAAWMQVNGGILTAIRIRACES